MAYNLQMAQINVNVFGLAAPNTVWGFPNSTNFHTLLMSYWMCGPLTTVPGSTGSPGVWPAFDSAGFFKFVQGLITLGGTSPFYTGNFPNPQPTTPGGCLLHCLMSVDTHAQVVQVYINDQPVTVTGSWTGTPPFNFNIGTVGSLWLWDVSNVASSGIHPAFGDAWISNPPSFVDLSVVANRRKFISRELQPVDLGATGTLPFGYQPAMYMSIRPGGVATDIQNNLGVGGGVWNASGGVPPTFQTDGTCTVLARSFLDMDNVIATATLRPFVAGNQVFLSWSDDRAHSFGSPVGQPIGATGAYLTSVQYQRLGYARDRVFKLEWSVPVSTALLGAYIEIDSSPKS